MLQDIFPKKIVGLRVFTNVRNQICWHFIFRKYECFGHLDQKRLNDKQRYRGFGQRPSFMEGIACRALVCPTVLKQKHPRTPRATFGKNWSSGIRCITIFSNNDHIWSLVAPKDKFFYEDQPLTSWPGLVKIGSVFIDFISIKASLRMTDANISHKTLDQVS